MKPNTLPPSSGGVHHHPGLIHTGPDNQRKGDPPQMWIRLAVPPTRLYSPRTRGPFRTRNLRAPGRIRQGFPSIVSRPRGHLCGWINQGHSAGVSAGRTHQQSWVMASWLAWLDVFMAVIGGFAAFLVWFVVYNLRRRVAQKRKHMKRNVRVHGSAGHLPAVLRTRAVGSRCRPRRSGSIVPGVERLRRQSLHCLARWWSASNTSQVKQRASNLSHLRPELIRRTVEILRKCSHGLYVRGYCSQRVITTLEFFQPHLSKMGTGTNLVTHTLRQITKKCSTDAHA